MEESCNWVFQTEAKAAQPCWWSLATILVGSERVYQVLVSHMKGLLSWYTLRKPYKIYIQLMDFAYSKCVFRHGCDIRYDKGVVGYVSTRMQSCKIVIRHSRITEQRMYENICVWYKRIIQGVTLPASKTRMIVPCGLADDHPFISYHPHYHSCDHTHSRWTIKLLPQDFWRVIAVVDCQLCQVVHWKKR